MPRQPDYTLRNSRVICGTVLVGSYLVVATIFILVLVSLSLHHTYVLNSLAVCAAALVYLIFVQMLMRRDRYHAAAYLLVLFFAFIATNIVWSWGINTPLGTLLFSLVVVLAGILLTARHALFAALGAGLLLTGIQEAITLKLHVPDMSWSGRTSDFGDVLAYFVVFSMLALISWLYNREMERSLTQARQAEIDLSEQKATLELQVEKRTAELRQVQLEEMQQMYRFSELGQLGIVLLHDLANYVTALTLEFEGLRNEQHDSAVARAREIIRYLEAIVYNTRERLHGGTQKHAFNIVRKTSEAIAFLGYKASKQGVAIEWQPPKESWKYSGDPISYCQVIVIIVSNAIDAYRTSGDKKRKVIVTIQQNSAHITIKISDWGIGISASDRKQLFKPHHSTKKSGLGLGLYIARQTIEMQFSGSIAINSRNKHTEFIIKLPLKNGK